jgi:hypothetical protein
LKFGALAALAEKCVAAEPEYPVIQVHMQRKQLELIAVLLYVVFQDYRVVMTTYVLKDAVMQLVFIFAHQTAY